MASPSTSTLRSGTVSRFSGGGALEKFWIGFGACCWNGANRSPPNQPPLRGCGRDHPPKLKNCADAGPTTPTNSATATASAISGPVSVNSRKKDFFCGMRFGRNGTLGNSYDSGIGPQAGRFHAINRTSVTAVKAIRKYPYQRVTLGPKTGASLPPQPLQHGGSGKPICGDPDRGLEAPQRLACLAAELAVRNTTVEAALGQELLQFQPLGARQFAFPARPGLHEGRPAAQPVGEMADRQRIGFGRVVFHDHPKILQHQKARPLCAGGRQQVGLLGRIWEALAAGALDAEMLPLRDRHGLGTVRQHVIKP